MFAVRDALNTGETGSLMRIFGVVETADILRFRNNQRE